jgi:hypothetical protein
MLKLVPHRTQISRQYPLAFHQNILLLSNSSVTGPSLIE